MKKGLLKSALFIVVFLYATNLYGFSQEQSENIAKLVELFNNRNVEDILDHISYPLSRQYPIQGIKNKEEMKTRFDEIFDDELIEIITDSDLEQDWNEMGWKGIMLGDGVLWLNGLASKIIAINHQSNIEKQKRQKIIKSMKDRLHNSLKVFQEPVIEVKTKRFLIRIDDIGDYKYRYAVWPISSNQSEKPDLILNNGEWHFDGSGGSYYITFRNGNYKYKVYIFGILGEGETFGELEVYEKDNRIVYEPIIEILKP